MPQKLTGRYNPKMAQEKVSQDLFQILGVQQAPLFWSPQFCRHLRLPPEGNQSSPSKGNQCFRLFVQAVFCPKQGGLRHTSATLNESVRALCVAPNLNEIHSPCLSFPSLTQLSLPQIGLGVCQRN